jgi:hypothetical protein
MTLESSFVTFFLINVKTRCSVNNKSNFVMFYFSGLESGLIQQQGMNVHQQQQQQQQQQQMVGGLSMATSGTLTMAGGTMTMANGK